MYLALYVLLLAVLLLHAPANAFDPGAREFVLIIGSVGIWRYGWGAVHFIRAMIYLKARFPRLRRSADRLVAFEQSENAATTPAPPVHIVITSYRIQTETTIGVFRAVFEEAIRYGGSVTVVAAIVEMAEMRLVKRLYQRMGLADKVDLVFVRLPGTGKRDALAVSLQAVSRRAPSPDGAVVVMDGDAILAPGTLARTMVFFRLIPGIAGLTTDEDAVIDGGYLVSKWHRMRFAQRHLLMSSMALSGRLLTMTGRMSVFRAGVATDPGFIEQVREDALDHWRLGRIKLITGEDKSTWYWLLRNGHRMLYVPDVRVLTIEHPPGRWFPLASTRLMKRWFGNMLRAGSRAIELGPRRIGMFTWWCLIDQRVSMWTPLIGPIAALCLGLGVSPVFLYLYLVWVMLTRLIQALMLLALRPTISGVYPLLIYYNQVYGALIKSYMLFRPDVQGWTRQRTRLEASKSSMGTLRLLGSAYVHAIAMLTLITAVAFMTGLLALPRVGSLTLPF